MASFLLTWNPRRWSWDDLNECIEDAQNGVSIGMSWSTGGTKRIQIDDLGFMMRLGKEPKGVMGYGRFTSSCYLDAHWSGEQGRTANYADIEFDVLLSEEDLLDLEVLKGMYPQMHWTPEASGISMPDDVAQGILRLLKQTGKEVPPSPKTTLLEGVLKRVTIDRKERNPEARRKCIAYHGHVCAVCKFDFEQFYGDTGRDFIHVHHLDPLSNAKEKREVDPINDLIPLCANCHSIIHRRKNPYTIEEVRSMISTHGKWTPHRRRS